MFFRTSILNEIWDGFGRPKSSIFRLFWSIFRSKIRWAAQVAMWGPIEAQWGGPVALGLQKEISEAQCAERAGATYARFLLYY